jgi:hypothetical protein
MAEFSYNIVEEYYINDETQNLKQYKKSIIALRGDTIC